MVDKNDPLSISIYPTSFENKDYVVEIINNYNKTISDDSKKIQYTDYIGMMISSITVIIDAITYILIAFVSISLIVSSSAFISPLKLSICWLIFSLIVCSISEISWLKLLISSLTFSLISFSKSSIFWFTSWNS